jgi:hypothetical protein
MIAGNQLGKIRKVMVEYPWLSTLTENDGNKQAAWRTNPSKVWLAMGDIGTHAAQLAEYISGLKITMPTSTS